MPRVSIITPCHNAEPFVGRMLDSVRLQRFADWEHIIVDDGSPDRSAEIIAQAGRRELRLRLIRQPNAGAINARNNGFAAASADSDYLLFLDADDALEPDMLSTLVGYLDAHPRVGMVYCEPTWVDADDQVIQYGSPGVRYVPSRFGIRRLRPDEAETPFIALFFWSRVTPSISLLRRSAYELTGGWNEAQGFWCEESDLFFKIALRSSIHYLPRRLVRRRRHEQQHGPAAAIREQEKKLYRRWLAGDGLNPKEQASVQKAWRLRQARLLPMLWLIWGSGYLKRLELRPALTCYLRSLRRVATYAGAALRRQVPAGPIW